VLSNVWLTILLVFLGYRMELVFFMKCFSETLLLCFLAKYGKSLWKKKPNFQVCIFIHDVFLNLVDHTYCYSSIQFYWLDSFSKSSHVQIGTHG